MDRKLNHRVVPLLDWAAVEDAEQRVLAEQLAGWSERFPQVEVRRLVNRDHPTNTLVELSAGARLLVVGSRGRGGLAGMLLASVSRTQVHHAHARSLWSRRRTRTLPDPGAAAEVLRGR